MAKQKRTNKDRCNTQVVEPIRKKEDIKRIINYLNIHNKHNYAVLFELGVNSGLRISDLLKLRVKDVLNQTHLTLREQKTNKSKSFPLKQTLQVLLNDFCKDKSSNDFLFVSSTGQRLNRVMVYKQLVSTCLKLNIDANIGTHTMRKSFGYHHYRQFKDITLLQTIFNHSTPEVTKRYIGITQDEINASYLALNLDPPVDEVEKAKLSSKIRARRIVSYCNNYIKNGGQEHKQFAKTILELVQG